MNCGVAQAVGEAHLLLRGPLQVEELLLLLLQNAAAAAAGAAACWARVLRDRLQHRLLHLLLQRPPLGDIIGWGDNSAAFSIPCVCACVCACAFACACACVRACVCMCVRTPMCICVCTSGACMPWKRRRVHAGSSTQAFLGPTAHKQQAWEASQRKHAGRCAGRAPRQRAGGGSAAPAATPPPPHHRCRCPHCC